MLTFTEENYLKCIFKLTEKTNQRVSTNAIARVIESSAASVTDMLKKLAEKELVDYEKYKGVHLSPSGKHIATQLVRKHRLWEVFLVDKLGFSWDEVHDIAEELEHIKSDTLVERMDRFLGRPKFDPHGDPIPTAEGKFTLRQQVPMNKASQGQRLVVLGVQEHSKAFLRYLDDLSIHIGTHLVIEEKNSFDQSMKVLIDDKHSQLLGEQICKKLLVNEI
jgi:DtxR family Mn-dependent transcriptional regulator